MILKRIAEGIKDQDWFVVGIEVMVVVIGVYLGIYIGDTAAKKAIKRDANISLELLAGDLREDIVQLDAVLAHQQINLNKYNESVNVLRSNPLDFEMANTSLSLLITMEAPNFYPNRSTYQVMLSEGHLGALESLALRQKITKLFEYSFNRNATYSESYNINTDETYRNIIVYHYDLSTGQLIAKSEDDLTRLRSGLMNQALYIESFVAFMQSEVREPIGELLSAIDADIAMHSDVGSK